MIYITKRRNKNAESISDTKVREFLNQFNETNRYIMTGHVIFTGDIFNFIDRELNRPDLPKEQEAVMTRASSLIGYLAEEFVDSLTELYAGITEEDYSPTLSDDDAFVTGYRNALSHYTETTYSILQKDIFKGKDNSIAKSFYMALGLELADRLKAMMHDPKRIPTHCEPETTALFIDGNATYS